MTDWTAFAGFSGVVLVLLLLLARASQSMLSTATSDGSTSVGTETRPSAMIDAGDGPAAPTERDLLDSTASANDGSTGVVQDATAETTTAAAGTTDVTDATTDVTDATTDVTDATTHETDATTDESGGTTAGADQGEDASANAANPGSASPDRENAPPSADTTTSADWTSDGLNRSGSGGGPQQFGTGALLANVLVTHGLFAGLVAGAAVYWEVPASALGVSAPELPALQALPVLGWGVAAGLALYVANEVGAASATRLGIDHEEALRELLAPDSPAGWVLLLGGVLPVVAVGEELIFRGVLVGALSVGFGLPVWGLAVASSVAFALGHGAQGTGGIVVTGLLGFALAAAFVLSGSLLLVIVAHYVVNALEFVVHEGLGVEWAD